MNFGLEFGLARKKVGNFLTPIFHHFLYLISHNSIWHPIYRWKSVVLSSRISYQSIFSKKTQVLDLWNRKCTYNWPFFGTKSAKTGYNKQTGAFKQVIFSLKHLQTSSYSYIFLIHCFLYILNQLLVFQRKLAPYFGLNLLKNITFLTKMAVHDQFSSQDKLLIGLHYSSRTDGITIIH